MKSFFDFKSNEPSAETEHKRFRRKLYSMYQIEEPITSQSKTKASGPKRRDSKPSKRSKTLGHKRAGIIRKPKALAVSESSDDSDPFVKTGPAVKLSGKPSLKLTTKDENVLNLVSSDEEDCSNNVTETDQLTKVEPRDELSDEDVVILDESVVVEEGVSPRVVKCSGCQNNVYSGETHDCTLADQLFSTSPSMKRQKTKIDAHDFEPENQFWANCENVKSNASSSKLKSRFRIDSPDLEDLDDPINDDDDHNDEIPKGTVHVVYSDSDEISPVFGGDLRRGMFDSCL